MCDSTECASWYADMLLTIKLLQCVSEIARFHSTIFGLCPAGPSCRNFSSAMAMHSSLLHFASDRFADKSLGLSIHGLQHLH